jgi:hypothetical protein
LWQRRNSRSHVLGEREFRAMLDERIVRRGDTHAGRCRSLAASPHRNAAARCHQGVFKSSREFREVMDRIFTIMSEDPEIGPRLRDADVPQRFEFDDLDLVRSSRVG